MQSSADSIQILTDDVARENFQKYGNPDGPGTFSVAIAMPKFLLEKENHIQVLLVSFFFLLVVVPGFLYMHFKDDTVKDERGVLLANKQIFAKKLNEMMIQKNLPQVAAVTVEFQSIGARSQEEVDLMKKILRDNEEIKELMPKAVSRNTQNMNMLPLVVILSHMMQVPEIKNPAFRENLAHILKLGPQHIAMMIELGSELNAAHRMGASPKQLKARNFKDIIEFSQHFVQGLWFGAEPLLQLPYFTPDEVKNYKRILKDHQIIEGSIQTFCKLEAEKRAKLGLFGGDAAKLGQLEKAVRAMPVVEVAAQAFTEGAAVMTMMDVITLCFSVKYTNLAATESPGYVHSEHFPFLKRQKWYLLVTDGATREFVIACAPLDFKDKDGNDTNTAKLEIKQRFGKAGQFSFHAYFICDSYIGFDKEVELKFAVQEEDKDRVIPEYTQEDMEAINGPSLVESLMAGDSTRDDDSDPDEDQASALMRKLKAAGIGKVSEESQLVQ